MAVLFPVKGLPEYLHSPNPASAKWGYRDLQQVVGGTFEILYPIVNPHCDRVMIVNEEARIRQLPWNEEASELWKRWGGRERLRGPVLLVKSSEIE